MRVCVAKWHLSAQYGPRLASGWPTALAFGLPFMLYLLTLAPTIYNLDSAELTTAAATGGLLRATGYPLYLLLGHLWSWLPVGDIGYRLNVFSAFNGALTIALAERVMRHLDVGGLARFGALGLLACSRFFWALSLIAEVYTLQTALMAGLILLLLRWDERPTSGRLALVGLALGLGLSHHGASVLLLPGCAWLLLHHPRRLPAPRALLPALGALVAGLSMYLYLPLHYAAHPRFNYAGVYDATGTFHPINLQTWSGFWWLVSGRSFDALMFAYSPPDSLQQLAVAGAQLWQAFFAIGIGPGLLGIVALARQRPQIAGMTMLMFGAHVIFFINYRVLDKETMFLPAHLIWTLWLAVGLHSLVTWGSATVDRQTASLIQRILGGLLALAVLLAAAWNWRQVDLSHDWSARERGEAILRVAEPHALILGYWQTAPLIEYLQLVEGQRPDVQVINRTFLLPGALPHLVLSSLAHRPIYIDNLPNDLSEHVDAHPAGPLYRLQLKPLSGSSL